MRYTAILSGGACRVTTEPFRGRVFVLERQARPLFPLKSASQFSCIDRDARARARTQDGKG